MYNMLCLCCSFIINFFYNVYSFLLQMRAGGIGGGVDIYQGFGGETGGYYYCKFFIIFSLVPLFFFL